MKLSEMNERQKKAFVNVYYASQELIGGLENALEDNSKDSEYYKRAYAELNNHDLLVKHLYELATTGIYGDGWACYDTRTVTRELRDINFCGKEFIMERCERRITKEGY